QWRTEGGGRSAIDALCKRRLRGGHEKYYFFFFFLLRRSSRRSRRFAPATLTAEAGFPTRASVSDTVRIVPGIARPDAMPTPKRLNTLRREIKSDLILSRIIYPPAYMATLFHPPA